MTVRVAHVALVVIGLAAGLAGLPWDLRPAQPVTAAAGKPGTATVMWVEQDGQARPFENGGRVTVGDVTVEIFVAPYPPLREGSIDLYLTDRVTGKPLQGNALKIIFDMYMPHGSIRAEALPTGGGHYLIPYKLVMPGQWRVDFTITRSGGTAAFALIFKVD